MEKEGFTQNCHSELVSESLNHEMLSFTDRLATAHSVARARFVKQVQHDKRGAFTLAEVLITLTIIGVIAALAIPNLMQKYQKHTWVTALKKQYNIISNVQSAINREVEISGDLSKEQILALRQTFKVNTKSEECENKQVKPVIGCSTLPFSSLKTLNDASIETSKHIIAPFYYGDDRTAFFKMEDGATIGIHTRTGLAGGYMWHLHGISPILYIVDVNGPSLPNKLGRDIFLFVVKNNAVVPLGLNDTRDCNVNDTGDSCAAYLFKNGWKMDY